MEKDGAAGPAADPPHDYQANDLSVSNYFRHCVCEAILYNMLLCDHKEMSMNYMSETDTNTPSDRTWTYSLTDAAVSERIVLPLPSDGYLMFIFGR